jgi:hypothetical protein
LEKGEGKDDGNLLGSCNEAIFTRDESGGRLGFLCGFDKIDLTLACGFGLDADRGYDCVDLVFFQDLSDALDVVV